jgi:hypothetical protein
VNRARQEVLAVPCCDAYTCDSAWVSVTAATATYTLSSKQQVLSSAHRESCRPEPPLLFHRLGGTGLTPLAPLPHTPCCRVGAGVGAPISMRLALCTSPCIGANIRQSFSRACVICPGALLPPAHAAVSRDAATRSSRRTRRPQYYLLVASMAHQLM